MARFNVLSGSTATPVLEPGFGQMWLVPVGASGDWAAHEGEIAIGNGNAGYLYRALVDGDEVFVVDTDTLYLVAGGGALRQLSPVPAAITVVIGNGVDTIPTGISGDIEVPFACDIVGWSALGNESGSIAIDIWKDTYANFPPTVEDTIIESGKPTISAATKGESSDVSGWTPALAARDILRFNVDSVTSLKQVTLTLRVLR